jgi:hypothetical protein
MNIAWQRFHAAALDLARSGTVKERLQRAYRQHLADLDENQLPPDLRAEFASLARTLTREKPMRGEDALAATIRKLSNAESDKIAGTLVELFGRLSRLSDGDADDAPLPAAVAAPLPAAATATARVIPLFAEARP